MGNGKGIGGVWGAAEAAAVVAGMLSAGGVSVGDVDDASDVLGFSP
jgi:hypothetical protein